MTTADSSWDARRAVAAFAPIQAATARDMYTARKILGHWAVGPDAATFAGTVAAAAGVILRRMNAGDRDAALHVADDALDVALLVQCPFIRAA
jgi:hypothetical protein